MKRQKQNITHRYADAAVARAIAASVALSTALALMARLSTAQAEKSCEEVGGKPLSSRPGCDLKFEPASFGTTFTGKF